MTTTQRSSHLAWEYCGKRLPLQVLSSQAGFYIGAATDEGPCGRDSLEYWPTEGEAKAALESGNWTQRDEP